MLVERTNNIGLKTLIDLCGFKKIDSTTVSFGLSPRINACGKVRHADEALELFWLIIGNYKKLAEKMNEYNSARQQVERKI